MINKQGILAVVFALASALSAHSWLVSDIDPTVVTTGRATFLYFCTDVAEKADITIGLSEDQISQLKVSRGKDSLGEEALQDENPFFEVVSTILKDKKPYAVFVKAPLVSDQFVFHMVFDEKEVPSCAVYSLNKECPGWISELINRSLPVDLGPGKQMSGVEKLGVGLLGVGAVGACMFLGMRSNNKQFGLAFPRRVGSARSISDCWNISLSALKRDFGNKLTSLEIYPKKRFFFERFLQDRIHDDSIVKLSRRGIDESVCVDRMHDAFAGSLATDLDSIVSVYPKSVFEYRAMQALRVRFLGYDPFIVTLNFSNPNMFWVYGHEILCQDEQQCLEFPALALAREYLCNFFGTDYLDLNRYSFVVHNVYRHFSFNRCLYGQKFIDSSLDVIQRNTTDVSGQGCSATILPIVAPLARDFSRYSAVSVRQFLLNVLTGFLHVRDFSRSLGKKNLVIHGGRLGAGAFGNNIHLALLMQVIAAACIESSLGADESFKLELFMAKESEIERVKAIFQEFRSAYGATKKNLDGTVKIIMGLIDKHGLHPATAQFGL